MAKIIIVDDDKNIRDVLTKFLTSKGHQVIPVPDGLNAIATIKSNLPDLVILDIHLPFAHGDNVFKKIRDISKSIKIAILTGYDDIPSDRYIENGAVLFMSKSEGFTNIINKIENIIKTEDRIEQTIVSNQEKVNILVIDDDEYILNFIEKFLLSKGYNPIKASTVKQAIEISSTKKPVITLLDIFLTDGEGIEYINYIREKNIPTKIIVISGNEEESIARNYLKNGAIDYIKKPIDLKRLELIIKTVLICY